MKKVWIVIIAVILVACAGPSDERQQKLNQWMTSNGKIKVLSTVAMISDLVDQIGGEYVEGTTLIQGDLDPHAYQLVKGDGEKFVFADLIFYIGLGLEHGPSWQLYLHENPKAIGLGNQLPPDLILYDDCGQRDPHIWTDISLFAKTVPFIVQALSEQDPSHADYYRERGSKVTEEMLAKHVELQGIMQRIPPNRRFFVTSHDAFNYFTRAYLSTPRERELEDWQKRFASPEGLAPDSQLSLADISAIIEHLQCYNIQVLFPESNLSKDSIRKIVQAGCEKGLKLKIAETALYGDAMGPVGSDGDTYLKMMEHNIKTLSKFLNEAPHERTVQNGK